jgi:hypothetical protein
MTQPAPNLIWIKEAFQALVKITAPQRVRAMAILDIEIVVLVVSAFTIFGGVLGWASWEESRAARRKRRLHDQAASSKSIRRNTAEGRLMAEIARPTGGGRPQRRSF